MRNIPAQLLVPLGAVVAALVAGLFSFFNLVLSKEQKLSELRHGWIDGLREDLATYMSAVFAVEYLDRVYRNKHGENVDIVELAKAKSEPHTRASTSFSSILLRLNPHDSSAAQVSLVKLMNDTRVSFNDSQYKTAIDLVPELRKQAQMVLKAEWTRVKQGEPTFRWSKRLVLLGLLGALGFGGLLVYQASANSGLSSPPPASTADTVPGAPGQPPPTDRSKRP